MSQYTAQLLIPQVDACIDLIQHANYHIPTLQHGNRVLVQRDRDVESGSVYQYTEADYVDGYEPDVYALPDAELNSELDDEQVARLQKLNDLMLCFVCGFSASSKKVKQALTAQQYNEFTNLLTSQQHPNEYPYSDGLPDALRLYKSYVQKADFKYNAFDRMSSSTSSGRVKYKPETISRAYNKSDGLYERAIEHLAEIWAEATTQKQYELQMWMDRDIDFDAGMERTIGIGPVLIPRVRGSRSTNALDSGLPKLSKRLKRKECQLLALREAAWKLAFKPKDQAPVEFTEEEVLQLKIRSQKLMQLTRKNNY